MHALIAHLRSLRAHGEWADRRLLDAARTAAAAPEALREMAHVRGAQEVWLARIERRTPALAVWPGLTLDELEAAGTSVDAAWRAYFAGLRPEALRQAIEYSNSTGRTFVTPLAEILLHLVTHGQYHRGKANVALRTAGAAPVGVDYILWQRERQVDPTDTD